MSSNTPNTGVTTVSSDVGDAVGLPNSYWFVAIVRNNSEKSVAEKLQALGYETYVAAQKQLRIWKNGRKAVVDNVLIRTMVFVRCSEKERLEIVKYPFITRFLTNRAGDRRGSMTNPIARIPDSQISTLRFMLGQSDFPVEFAPARFKKHDRVRVVRGSLRGLEGEVDDVAEGKSELIIRIDLLGCASVRINTSDLQPITESACNVM